jgi:hypothetical protein
LCTDLCPRHLIGHELSPHLLVRAVNYQQAATPHTAHGPDLFRMQCV